MKNPKDNKERNLIKSALRRVFSRSNLRREALERQSVEYTDPKRPRVTKWGWCAECGEFTPNYLLEVDHVNPVIKLDETLEDLNWDELVDRIWCDIGNLRAVDKTCHKIKSKQENKERREFKKGNK